MFQHKFSAKQFQQTHKQQRRVETRRADFLKHEFKQTQKRQADFKITPISPHITFENTQMAMGHSLLSIGMYLGIAASPRYRQAVRIAAYLFALSIVCQLTGQAMAQVKNADRKDNDNTPQNSDIINFDTTTTPPHQHIIVNIGLINDTNMFEFVSATTLEGKEVSEKDFADLLSKIEPLPKENEVHEKPIDEKKTDEKQTDIVNHANKYLIYQTTNPKIAAKHHQKALQAARAAVKAGEPWGESLLAQILMLRDREGSDSAKKEWDEAHLIIKKLYKAGDPWAVEFIKGVRSHGSFIEQMLFPLMDATEDIVDRTANTWFLKAPVKYALGFFGIEVPPETIDAASDGIAAPPMRLKM